MKFRKAKCFKVLKLPGNYFIYESNKSEGEKYQDSATITKWKYNNKIQFSSVQSLSRVQLFATPWIAARQASLSITISWSSLKLMSIEENVSNRNVYQQMNK